jgi:hypothetical protein
VPCCLMLAYDVENFPYPGPIGSETQLLNTTVLPSVTSLNMSSMRGLGNSSRQGLCKMQVEPNDCLNQTIHCKGC